MNIDGEYGPFTGEKRGECDGESRGNIASSSSQYAFFQLEIAKDSYTRAHEETEVVIAVCIAIYHQVVHDDIHHPEWNPPTEDLLDEIDATQAVLSRYLGEHPLLAVAAAHAPILFAVIGEMDESVLDRWPSSR